jgi:hypothetical protein
MKSRLKVYRVKPAFLSVLLSQLFPKQLYINDWNRLSLRGKPIPKDRFFDMFEGGK